MDGLAERVKATVLEYAGGGHHMKVFPLSNEQHQVYTILMVDTPVHRRPANIVVSARVVGDWVIVDEDTTDRPIVEALVRNGVPPEKIIKAYAGEPIPVEENP